MAVQELPTDAVPVAVVTDSSPRTMTTSYNLDTTPPAGRSPTANGVECYLVPRAVWSSVKLVRIRFTSRSTMMCRITGPGCSAANPFISLGNPTWNSYEVGPINPAITLLEQAHCNRRKMEELHACSLKSVFSSDETKIVLREDDQCSTQFSSPMQQERVLICEEEEEERR
ncbi:unnamed protein product [Nesidiocoris tenuis]|uniref:Uncharacterized protein n=1 Tax=Nesidiocoris tenuis TaxID=355587 RepID=A0A6H5GKQ1_9HEMI|nr:unnamed protein product [Nesidiocoris tenuis]